MGAGARSPVEGRPDVRRHSRKKSLVLDRHHVVLLVRLATIATSTALIGAASIFAWHLTSAAYAASVLSLGADLRQGLLNRTIDRVGSIIHMQLVGTGVLTAAVENQYTRDNGLSFPDMNNEILRTSQSLYRTQHFIAILGCIFHDGMYSAYIPDAQYPAGSNISGTSTPSSGSSSSASSTPRGSSASVSSSSTVYSAPKGYSDNNDITVSPSPDLIAFFNNQSIPLGEIPPRYFVRIPRGSRLAAEPPQRVDPESWVDFRDRHWYQKAVANPHQAFGHVLVAADPEVPLLIVSHAVQSLQEETFGVCTICHSMTFLSEFISTLDLKGGLIFLVNDDGYMVATSSGEMTAPEEIERKRLLNVSESSDRLTRESWRAALQHSGGMEALSLTSLRVEVDIGGTTYYLDTVSIPNSLHMQLVAVLAVPRSSIMAQIDSQSRRAVVGIVGSICVLVIVSVLAVVIFTEPVSNELRLKAELVVLKQKAEEESRAKSQFLSNCSHELRSPMAAIIGLLDLLLTDDLPAEQMANVSQIRKCADGLLGLLNDLLDIGKIEAGKLELESVDFDIEAELESLIDVFNVQYETKGVELALDLADNFCWMVKGDPARVRQIFSNLLSNSYKFTPRGGQVILRGHQRAPSLLLGANHSGRSDSESGADACNGVEDDGEVQAFFQVDDTGCGIPPEKRDLVFESFTQADTSSTRVYGGSGLGLAIVRNLISMMGGRIGIIGKDSPGTLIALDLRFLPATSASSQVGASTIPLPTSSSLMAELSDLSQDLRAPGGSGSAVAIEARLKTDPSGASVPHGGTDKAMATDEAGTVGENEENEPPDGRVIEPPGGRAVEPLGGRAIERSGGRRLAAAARTLHEWARPVASGTGPSLQTREYQGTPESKGAWEAKGEAESKDTLEYLEMPGSGGMLECFQMPGSRGVLVPLTRGTPDEGDSLGGPSAVEWPASSSVDESTGRQPSRNVDESTGRRPGSGVDEPKVWPPGSGRHVLHDQAEGSREWPAGGDALDQEPEATMIQISLAGSCGCRNGADRGLEPIAEDAADRGLEPIAEKMVPASRIKGQDGCGDADPATNKGGAECEASPLRTESLASMTGQGRGGVVNETGDPSGDEATGVKINGCAPCRSIDEGLGAESVALGRPAPNVKSPDVSKRGCTMHKDLLAEAKSKDSGAPWANSENTSVSLNTSGNFETSGKLDAMGKFGASGDLDALVNLDALRTSKRSAAVGIVKPRAIAAAFQLHRAWDSDKQWVTSDPLKLQVTSDPLKLSARSDPLKLQLATDSIRPHARSDTCKSLPVVSDPANSQHRSTSSAGEAIAAGHGEAVAAGQGDVVGAGHGEAVRAADVQSEMDLEAQSRVTWTIPPELRGGTVVLYLRGTAEKMIVAHWLQRHSLNVVMVEGFDKILPALGHLLPQFRHVEGCQPAYVSTSGNIPGTLLTSCENWSPDVARNRPVILISESILHEKLAAGPRGDVPVEAWEEMSRALFHPGGGTVSNADKVRHIRGLIEQNPEIKNLLLFLAAMRRRPDLGQVVVARVLACSLPKWLRSFVVPGFLVTTRPLYSSRLRALLTASGRLLDRRGRPAHGPSGDPICTVGSTRDQSDNGESTAPAAADDALMTSPAAGTSALANCHPALPIVSQACNTGQCIDGGLASNVGLGSLPLPQGSASNEGLSSDGPCLAPPSEVSGETGGDLRDTRMVPEGEDHSSQASIVRRNPAGTAAGASASSAVTKDLTGLRILVAEDTPVLQRLAVAMLSKFGASVHTVADGQQAVAAVLATKSFDGSDPDFDVVLMDCQMPNIDGYDATCAIRKAEQGQGRRQPIIALTAHAMASDRVKCLQAGMDHYHTKPINMKRLVEIIRKLCPKTTGQ